MEINYLNLFRKLECSRKSRPFKEVHLQLNLTKEKLSISGEISSQSLPLALIRTICSSAEESADSSSSLRPVVCTKTAKRSLSVFEVDFNRSIVFERGRKGESKETKLNSHPVSQLLKSLRMGIWRSEVQSRIRLASERIVSGPSDGPVR